MSFAPSFRPARLRALGVAVGVVTGLGAGVLTAGSASAASGDSLAALRACESGGNYSINTGNGFYGAYQFDAGTWHGLGLSGLPSQASPAVQDQAVRTLQAQRGWSPWPACSKKLGLSGAPSGASAAPAPAAAPAASTATATAAAAASTARHRAEPSASRSATRTAAPRHLASSSDFTVAMVGQKSDAVRAWQQQMVTLGYPLTVDGQYGPASARATHDFEVQHGLTVEAVGVVGGQVRAAMAQALSAKG